MSAAFTIVNRRTDERGNRYVVAALSGVQYSIRVEKSKRVRIPFRPSGTYGWRYSLQVIRLSDMRSLYYTSQIDKGVGVERALKLAGVLPI